MYQLLQFSAFLLKLSLGENLPLRGQRHTIIQETAPRSLREGGCRGHLRHLSL